jgi:hypothetical protein
MQTLEQALVAQGLVTPAQIAEARQLERELRGGLGLNLVRLRYVKEEEIVEACRRAVPGIGVADQALLARASSFALGLLPTPLIERYRAQRTDALLRRQILPNPGGCIGLNAILRQSHVAQHDQCQNGEEANADRNRAARQAAVGIAVQIGHAD